jgi:hypothetical protein
MFRLLVNRLTLKPDGSVCRSSWSLSAAATISRSRLTTGSAFGSRGPEKPPPSRIFEQVGLRGLGAYSGRFLFLALRTSSQSMTVPPASR